MEKYGLSLKEITEQASWYLDSSPNERAYPTADLGYSREINKKADVTTENKIINAKIVPGDIIYYSGHVMMIQSIEYDAGTRNAGTGSIAIIESVFGKDENNKLFAKVIKTRNLSHDDYINKNWHIVRLRTN